MTRFTSERRERFLTLLETGRNVEEACATVKIGRATVSRWAAAGREPCARQDQAEFAQRFDGVREGHTEARLTQADLVRLLETAARKGSVQAMKLLLERSWEKVGAGPPGETERDPFAALEHGDELAARRKRR